jgi:hypothetical protein
MKKLKLLIIFIVLSFLCSGNVFGQTGCVLVKTIGANPNSGDYIIGEDIEYYFQTSVPPGASNCELFQLELSWWNPGAPPSNVFVPCGESSDIFIAPPAAYRLFPGENVFTAACECDDFPPADPNDLCIEDSRLCYTTVGADLVDNPYEPDGLIDEWLAYYCLDHLIDYDDEDLPGTASDPVPNDLLDPCVEVTKTCVDTDGVDAGDPADFDILVENCGNAELMCESPELNGGAPFLLPEDGTYPETVSVSSDPDACLDDEPQVTNAITVVCSVPAANSPTEVDDSSDLASCPVNCEACIDVEKDCAEDAPVMSGDPIDFNIVISNCGDIPLTGIIVIDPEVGTVPESPIAGPLLPGEATEPISVTIGAAVCVESDIFDTGLETQENEVFVEADQGVSDSDIAICPCDEEETGGEGCTPGFWKIKSNGKEPCWCDTYIGNPLLNTVYSAAALAAIPHVSARKEKNSAGFTVETLDDALKLKGGGDLEGAVRKLLRMGTAALLNACTLNGGGNYPEGASTIISDINAAIVSQDIETIDNLKNTYGNWNECLPCTMNANCVDIDLEDAEEPEIECTDDPN